VSLCGCGMASLHHSEPLCECWTAACNTGFASVCRRARHAALASMTRHTRLPQPATADTHTSHHSRHTLNHTTADTHSVTPQQTNTQSHHSRHTLSHTTADTHSVTPQQTHTQSHHSRYTLSHTTADTHSVTPQQTHTQSLRHSRHMNKILTENNNRYSTALSQDS